MILDIANATIYKQKSKDVRETWIDKIKKGNAIAKDPRFRKVANMQGRNSPMFQTLEMPKQDSAASNNLMGATTGIDSSVITRRAGHSMIFNK
mmetsp:Transcript_29254/g.44080  ORF Transcript_29254/g.44080 Transcript_29254/m.44080 type:complete len:93 (-) Transcript_29254:301-579(-)